jgi:transmembrane sensor
MSEIEDGHALYGAENACAEGIEARAAAWLVARDCDETWSAESQVALDAWLAETPANLVTFWRLEAAFNRSHRLRALPSTRRQERRPLWKRSYRIVMALVIIAVLGSASFIYAFRPTETFYATAIGGRETITLADGSRIELNTNTSLRARIGSNRRSIVLDRGEAYFDVKHDPERPFVVIANGHVLTDIGTKFVVRSDRSQLEVSVLQGEVKFESRDGRLRQPLLLTPGDLVTAVQNKVFIAKQPVDDLKTKLGWQRGVIVFNHTTLADAAAEFNRYNREKIRIADSVAAQRLIGGIFPIGSVAAFTRLAHEVLGLRVEKQNNETVISR